MAKIAELEGAEKEKMKVTIKCNYITINKKSYI